MKFLNMHIVVDVSRYDRYIDMTILIGGMIFTKLYSYKNNA